MKTYEELTQIKTDFLRRYPVKRRSGVAELFSQPVHNYSIRERGGLFTPTTPPEQVQEWVVVHLVDTRNRLTSYPAPRAEWHQRKLEHVHSILKTIKNEPDLFVDLVEWYRRRSLEKYNNIEFKPDSTTVPAIDKQLKFLRSLGCKETPTSKLHASQLIGELVSPR